MTLGLGTGANTATFSILKAVSLNPFPYRDPDRLVTIAEADGRTPNPQSVAFPTVYGSKLCSNSFQALSLRGDFSIRPIERGQADFIRCMRVNCDFFDPLGIKMKLGQTFSRQDERPATANKLILSYGLWMRRFGGDAGVIGQLLPTVGTDHPTLHDQ